MLIVAALLLVVLFARLHQDAHRVQKRGTVLDVSARASSVEGSDVANVTQSKGDTSVRARIFGSRVKGSNIGNVGPMEQSKKPIKPEN